MVYIFYSKNLPFYKVENIFLINQGSKPKQEYTFLHLLLPISM